MKIELSSEELADVVEALRTKAAAERESDVPLAWGGGSIVGNSRHKKAADMKAKRLCALANRIEG